MRGGLVVVGLIVCAPGVAHAGRNFYGWLSDTDVMPERGVELQSWVAEENHDLTDNHRSVTEWGVAPFIGITDQLELDLPVAVEWFGTTSPPASAGTALTTFGGELRYRMVSNDPQDKPPFAPLVRVGLHRVVRTRDVLELNAGLSASYEAGSVHALVDVNFIGDVDTHDKPMDDSDGSSFAVRTGAGVSVEVHDDIRVGGEAFAEIGFAQPEAGNKRAWVTAGPGGSWTHGRFWLSAMYGIGVFGIGTAPRVQWGIAF